MRNLGRGLVLVNALLFLFSCGGGDSVETDPINNDPEEALLVRPLKDAVCNEGTIISETQSDVTFEWNATENTDSYILEVTNLMTNSLNSYNASATNKVVTLQRGVSYAWKVYSKSNTNTSVGESETWDFYNAGLGIENYAPFPAKVVSPTMGGLSGVTTLLKWEASDLDNDVLEYGVYLDTANPPVTKLGMTSSQQFNVSYLTEDMVYYWRIVTKDNHGNESVSPVFDFRTQ
ncbi:hypothetical protein [Flavicella sediminum]|uniref:hypothetical protein n=1 Tax=Flavicella sediminum TaxID=2585141 RepID=UPI001121C062|nr:hypothetical protein [Flavicella sediminum]